MQSETVLITGADGFIGSEMVRFMLNKGYNVIAIGKNLNQSSSNNRLTIINKRFNEIEDIPKTDILIHLAAITNTTSKSENEMLKVNVDDAERLFLKAIEKGCRKIVYSSSSAVYGNNMPPLREEDGNNPLNIYGKSKLILEKKAMDLCKAHPEVRIVGLRYSCVYGAGEQNKGKKASMVYQLINQIRAGKPVLFKYGEQVRDFIYIEDAVRATFLAISSQINGVFNVGLGKGHSFNEIVEIINKNLGRNVPAAYIDNPYKDQFQENMVLDISLIKEAIGFYPKIDLEEGINNILKTIQNTQNYG